MATNDPGGDRAANEQPRARIVDWVDDLRRREVSTGPTVGRSRLDTSLARLPVTKVSDRLAEQGVLAPEVLAERAMAGIDLKEEAKRLGIGVGQATALYQAAVDDLPEELRLDIEAAIAHPQGKGQIGPDDPEFEEFTRRIGVRKIPKLTKTKLKKWIADRDVVALLPRGPLAAVDHRAKLGDARNQGGRGTCTAFGSTAVAEALEFLRDQRPGPRDLSEELMFWYSKSGQARTAGGYDCGAALRHYGEFGSCEERYLPYWGTHISSNHAHVPVPDIAMDRAQFNSQSQVVAVPARDVASLKDVLRSGRCAAIATDTWNWNTATGTITFPDPLDSKSPGAGHCVSVIGFIDRDDLPAAHEGGYFIVRNSWGHANSTANLMGPDYGGHLLMPYGWYRRYTWSTYTLDDAEESSESARPWRAEFFTNRSLSGKPALEGTSADVDFDWNTGSPFKIPVPFLGVIDLGPKDDFSARFTQVRRFRPGWHRFLLRGDDGVRLWVDDRLVINQWKNQPASTSTAEHYLTGGDHVLRIEYYERGGLAEVELDVEPVEFHYELFANTSLAGSPAATFDDTMTDLEWRHAPPVGASPADGLFSVRANGQKAFDAGQYRFHARHTGGCRIWVENDLVLDDWSGTNPHGAPVAISGGTHTVTVHYRNLVPLNAPGVKGYYRAALAFEWSEEIWQASFYDDAARKAIHLAKYPNSDSIFEAFRTGALTGSAVFHHRYPTTPPAAATYSAQDGVPLVLAFPNLDAFTTGIPASAGVPSDWLGAHIRRRVWLPKGRYVFGLASDDGFRLIVDGKQLLQDHYISGADPFGREIELEAGVHDIAIEYANSKWGGKLTFRAETAEWHIQYFDGIELATPVATKVLARVEDIIAERPSSLGSTTYSVRAKRTMWLPLGRYRVTVRADDGVRLRIAGVPKIDAWTVQPPTGYTAHFEHKGGNVPIELEFFQKWGAATLEFELTPEGFLGEYYDKSSLEKAPAGSSLDRNVPSAYRFEPVIDFDWGSSGRLARVGSDRFSARWTGPIELPVGRWQFDLTADDGVRLFLDGRLLVDEWQPHAPTTHTKVIDLVGRRHDVRLEYFEQTAGAVCKLEFKRLF